ncbi:MAG: BlaI/MecI/CopY family transcriptional regulator, partial [Candidatus Omnitrophica bacterium]|nr:BlaI/MecI/CopY family transcriptional regulator [Candidatus Omnitrophota bacterium]
MPRPSSQHPTELELEILKILWRDGPSLAKHVCEEIQPFRKLAYTSVLTIMNIMAKKKYLKRTKEGKSFVYAPVIQEEETTQNMLSDLVNRAFGGSVATAMVNLLESG